MSIAFFSPYGLASEETGVLALLCSYLRQSNYAVNSLQCNGIFSLCERDAENGWRRGVRSCFSCMHEQSAVARWSGAEIHELSRFLDPDEVSESRRWSMALSRKTFEALPYGDLNVLPLVRDSFVARTGRDSIENASDEEFDTLRRMMLSSVRAMLASKRFLKTKDIQLGLVAGCRDNVSAAFVAGAQSAGVAVAEFRWDILSRSVQVTHPAADKAFSCPVVFDDVTEMRTDARTWPGEIIRLVDELMVFLEISTSQLQLPLAQ